VTAARRLLRHDARARNLESLAIGLAVASTLVLVAELVVVALVVAEVFRQGHTLGEVGPMLLAALGLLFVRAGLAVASEVASRSGAATLVSHLRADLTAHVLRLGPTWRSRERAGELGGLLIAGLGSIEDYLTQYLPTRWTAMIVPPLVALLVLMLDPPSVVVLLVTGPLLVLLLAVIGGRTRAISERRFREMRTLSAFFLDILRGISTLKLFGRSHEQADNLRRISGRYGDATMEVLRTAFQTSLVLEWGATIAIALVAVEIGLRLLEGSIAFERALAVLLVTPEFFLPLRALAGRFHVGTAGKAVIERTYEVLDEPVPGGARPIVAGVIGDRPSAAGPTVAGVTTSAPASGRGAPAVASVGTLASGREAVPQPAPGSRTAPTITLTAVGLTYPGRSTPALDGVDLVLESGTSVALVGASGAGKSTMASLLLRFIEPDRGHIMADGRPLGAYPVSEWRAALAWVPQRPHLFDGSVAENIRLARPDADDETVMAAARAAHAHEFIERLGAGYDTHIGEDGIRLSGGQRQRLAIARAFLRDAPLLVLDEATSQLDEATETAVADALARLMVGRTVLLVAHRLRLAQRADRIVVLDAGRIVEQGPPVELLAATGPYRRLADDAGDLDLVVAPGSPAKPHGARPSEPYEASV
jgi:ABC-type transport system involved in cytochrome bd biosynthesis fused ATPase/permease subunit